MKRVSTFQKILPYLILTLALVSGLIIVQPLRQLVNSRLNEFQSRLVDIVHQETGLTMRYGGLNPSILLQADFSDLRLERPDGSVLFSAAHVSISYSLFDLLRGQPIESVRSILLQHGSLDFDADKDAAYFTVEDAGPPVLIRNVLDKVSAALPSGMTISFLDMELSARGKDWRAGVSLSRASVKGSENELNVEVDSSLSANGSFGSDLPAHLSGGVSLSGTYFRANRQIQARIRTERLDSDWGRLAAQNFAVVLDNDVFTLRKIEDEQAFDFQLDYDFAGQVLHATLQTDKWQPRLAFEPAAGIPLFVKALVSARYDSSIQVSYAFPQKALSYQFSINGSGDFETFGKIAVNAHGSGGEKTVNFNDVKVEVPGLGFHYAGTMDFADLRMRGHVALDAAPPVAAFAFGVDSDLSGSILDGEGGVAFTNTRIDLDGYSVLPSELRVDNRDGVLLAHFASLLPSEGGAPGSIDAFVAYRLNQDSKKPPPVFGPQYPNQDFNGIVATRPAFALSLDLNGFDSGPASDLESRIITGLGIPIEASAIRSSMSGMRLDTSAELSWDGKVHGKIASLILRPATGGPALVSANASLDGETLTVDRLAVHVLDRDLSLSGSYEFSGPNLGELRASIAYGGTEPFDLRGNVRPNGAFDLAASFGIFASGSVGRDGITGIARIESLPFPSLGPDARLAMAASFGIRSESTWEIDLQTLDLSSVAFNPLRPNFTGRITAQDVKILPSGALGQLRFQDAFSTLEGPVRAAYDLGKKSPLTLNVALAAKGASPGKDGERISIQAALDSSGINVNYGLSNSPSNRLFSSGLGGYFSVSGRFSTDLAFSNPVVDGSVSLEKALFNQDPLSGSLKFGFAGGKLDLSGSDPQLTGTRLRLDTFVLNFKGANLSIASRIDRPQRPGSESVSFGGSASWPIGVPHFDDALFSGLRGVFSIKNLKGLGTQNSDYQFSANGRAGAINVSENTSGGFRARIQKDGGFTVQILAPFPISATVTGFIRQARIEANISNLSFEVAPVAEMFRSPFFQLTKGTISGSLRIIGDVNDPDFFGSLKGTGLSSSLSVLPSPVSASSAFLVFEEKQIRLLPFATEAAKGKAMVEGEFGLSRWGIQSWQFDISAKASDPVHVVSAFPNINVDALGSGNLSVSGSNGIVRIQGRLEADNANLQLSQAAAAATSASKGSDIQYIIDLSFTSGRNVQFYWPSKNFPILRSYAQVGQNAIFSLNQVANTWSLTGNVALRGGEILYLKRNFYIRNATIRFNENQLHFSPILDGSADMRTVANDKPLRISMVLNDSPLNDLRPRFEADPPMSTDEIASFFSHDLINPQNNTTDLASLAGSVVDVGSQVVLFNDLENGIRDTLGLDQFSFRTNLLQNLALSALVPQANPLDNQSISLGKYFDNTTIQMGKYIGDDVYVELLAQLNAVPINPSANRFGLSPSVELNLEWNTPFFTLLWNWAPQAADASKLWLPDNTFTFSRRIR